MKQMLKIREIQISLVIGFLAFIMLFFSRFSHPLPQETTMHLILIVTYIMLIIIISLYITLRNIHNIRSDIRQISFQCYKASLTVGILALGEGVLSLIAYPPIRGIDILFLTFFIMLFYLFIVNIYIMYSCIILSDRIKELDSLERENEFRTKK